MWKRLSTKDRQFDRTVGSPTLVETTADQQIFRKSTDINNGSFSISARPAFGRKGTDDVLKELPALPFRSLQIPGVGETRPMSEVQTVSSVYSQPSPEMNNGTSTDNHPPRSSSLYPDDVSPPESPHVDNDDKGRSGRGSPDVSPISESSNPSMKHSPISNLGRFNSNLPVPKKTRKFWNRPSPDTQEQGAKLTHWDVYSGEPTTSEKGKPPSTTPSAVKLNADPSPARLNGYGTSTHISAGSPNSTNVIGRKRVASRDINNTPIIRPEWKGAGGRHKIVNPLLDKPLPPGKTPTFPTGSEKHREEQKEKERVAAELVREQQEQREQEQRMKERDEYQKKQEAAAKEAEENARHQAQQMHEARVTHKETKHKEEDLRGEEMNEGKYPSAMNDRSRPTGQTVPARQSSVIMDKVDVNEHTQNPNGANLNDVTPRHSLKPLPLRSSSLTPPDDTRSPLARNPSNEAMQDRRSQPLPNLPQNEPPAANVTTGHKLRGFSPATPTVVPRQKFDEDDPSRIEHRFQADLRQMHLQGEPPSRFSATTYATTNYESPPDTPDLSSNSPSTFTSATTTPNSILNRKRPVPPAGIPNSKVISRKPTTSGSSVATQATPESKRKSLPKSPPEVNAVSRVASLQAKLDNLRRRRGNLQTVIYELTHVVQPSSIAYDMASRQEIKKTVEGLNNELADVIKDEHETGIKLHRTMKRDDEFAAYEPTSIWVRRVTT
ncbi:hypothetical protein ACLMJK_003153 [Lecanora helva]